MATLERAYDKRWNCHWCLNHQYFGKQKEKMLEKRRRIKGCWGNPASPYQIENIQFNSCIGNFSSYDAQYIIDMYMAYDKGMIPFPGSISEQPAKLLEAFDMIKSFRQRKEAEEQASKKSK